MNKNIEYFLTAAKYLNFTKAAKEHYISQQAFSDAIKRLENEYGVKLFRRRPSLSLSYEGERFLNSAKKLYLIDSSLKKELSEIASGIRGQINFGINPSRARFILPKFTKIFSDKYPLVDLQIHLNDTYKMETMLKNGRLDLFLGVNTNKSIDFSIRDLAKDKIYLIFSMQTKNLLDKYDYLNKNNHADLNKISNPNFILNLSRSTMTDEIKNILSSLEITYKNQISISDYQTQIEICRNSNYITFVPEFMLEEIKQSNKRYIKNEQLAYYPIANTYKPLDIQVVKLNYIDYPKYIIDFEKMLCDFMIAK